MTALIISILLLILAGIGKAIMDTLQFHFPVSIFSKYWKNKWLDPSISWRNKYKNNDPLQGEAFPGSTTIFVFVTDCWHFAQFVFLRSILAVVVVFPLSGALSLLGSIPLCLKLIIAYVGLSAIFGLTFTLFYSKLLKK